MYFVKMWTTVVFITLLQTGMFQSQRCQIGSHWDYQYGRCMICHPNCQVCSSWTSCQTCHYGYYGSGCRCSTRCEETCNSFDGSCTCKSGYYIHHFKQDGAYDCINCHHNCIKCTDSRQCDRCKPGFYGNICQNRCPSSCRVCDQVYGNCTRNCPRGTFYDYIRQECTPCLEHCAVCTSNTDCLSCKAGFFGRTCKTCSPLCLNGCRQQDGECLGCIDGFYKEGIQCRSCTNGCSMCRSKDTCVKCKKGYYLRERINCGICPEGCLICKSEFCTQCKFGYKNVNGTCVSCRLCKTVTPCYTKNQCPQCVDGVWGLYCLQNCRETCVRCDKVTGECNGCNNDTFGRFCELNCSKHCVKLSGENSSCWQHNGTCVHGCTDNYIGGNCTEEQLSDYTTSVATTGVASVVGAICGSAILIAMLLVSGILVKRKRQQCVNGAQDVADTTNENPNQHRLQETLNLAYNYIDVNPEAMSGAVNHPISEEANVYNIAAHGHSLKRLADSTRNQEHVNTYCHISHSTVSKNEQRQSEEDYDHVTRHFVPKLDNVDEI